MSIDELDMGYWIKVVMQKSFWHGQHREDQVLHIVEVDHEHHEQGIVEEAPSTENANVAECISRRVGLRVGAGSKVIGENCMVCRKYGIWW